MLSEQTFEGRHEKLNQANKLSRTYAMLLESLNRHRGKGQQKVTVEHVHVHFPPSVTGVAERHRRAGRVLGVCGLEKFLRRLADVAQARA